MKQNNKVVTQNNKDVKQNIKSGMVETIIWSASRSFGILSRPMRKNSTSLGQSHFLEDDYLPLFQFAFRKVIKPTG